MDYRIEKIAEDIKEGFTSGIIDGEDGERTYWEVSINTFKNNKDQVPNNHRK
jgi:hypothetical protein